MAKRHLLITGSMRSGTTYIGRVIEKSEEYIYLHEPFKNRDGIEGINYWFPFFKTLNHQSIVDKFFKGKAKFRIKKRKKSSVFKYWAKKVLGNKAQMSYNAAFKRNAPQKLLLKDPLAAFLSDYIHNEKAVDVIAVVRHPMAFYYSKKQKGWDFDFEHFMNQKELMDTFFQEEIDLIKKANDESYEFRIGLLWHCIYKVLHTYTNKNKDSKNWITVTHESLLDDPTVGFGRIFNTLEISFNLNVKGFIEETSSNKKALAEENKVHDFKRNANDLKYYWKKQVTQEQVDIIETLTSEIASHYYTPESWKI